MIGMGTAVPSRGTPASGAVNGHLLPAFSPRGELLLVVLDEGSFILAHFLEHRMAREVDPISSVDAWMNHCRVDHLLLGVMDATLASWSVSNKSLTAISSSQRGHRAPVPNRRHHVLRSSQRCSAR